MDSAIILNRLIEQDLDSLEILPGDWSTWKASAPSDGPHIPSSTFPFLFVEGHLGIPQKTLHRLYPPSTHFERSRVRPTDNCFLETLVKTTCITITNPAHQTALNTRKRLISLEIHDGFKELRFTGLLLRGVKHCAKESMLWDHRRWCLRRIYGLLPIDPEKAKLCIQHKAWSTATECLTFPNLPAQALREEFDLIRSACTIYPRNYHAWSHWHYIFDCCRASICYTSFEPQSAQETFLVMVEECQQLRQWILHHVTDFSAMNQFLLANQLLYALLEDNHALVPHEQLEEAKGKSSPSSLAREFWSLISSFPPHESLFLSLRSLLPHLAAEERDGYRLAMSRLEAPWRADGKVVLSTDAVNHK
ncbi:hypothetical protein FA15DRAFT_646571 [Coprinopsis marcescibilis]|uniref:Protein prenylyltransferase n=1 Tax=Coprinopsis marcescibilis TaxID=230819 RepID=A0A5C3KLC9_COPMA|nr:hypothetical protein FA15DRAFT_646571 [Coprinopsis marcescibilis]